MRRKKKFARTQRTFYQINQYIRAPEVRLIDEQGKQIDVLPIEKARQLSREQQLDLVEVGPQAQPPVVKLIDFKKFQYLEAKKKQLQKKKTKKGDLKEVKLTPYIAQGDYLSRLKKIKEFLKDQHRVKIFIPFRGRQFAHKTAGYDLVNRLLADLEDTGRQDQDPKFIGNKLVTFLTPVKKTAKKADMPTNNNKNEPV